LFKFISYSNIPQTLHYLQGKPVLIYIASGPLAKEKVPYAGVKSIHAEASRQYAEASHPCAEESRPFAVAISPLYHVNAKIKHINSINVKPIKIKNYEKE